jgi:hypothetical protein
VAREKNRRCAEPASELHQLARLAIRDALAFIREQPELFQRGLRAMGYRLVPDPSKYPATIKRGEMFSIEMTWKTAASVARCEISRCDSSSAPSKRRRPDRNLALDQGTDLHDRQSSETPHARSRLVPLHIALIDPATGKPIALPLKDGAIGTITIAQ